MTNHITLSDPISSDPVSADYRVLWNHDGIGVYIGYLTDLALDDDGRPGSGGFDAFDRGGKYVGTADDQNSAASLLAP